MFLPVHAALEVVSDLRLSAGVGSLGVVFVKEGLVGPLLLLVEAEVFDVGGMPVVGPGAGWK